MHEWRVENTLSTQQDIVATQKANSQILWKLDFRVYGTWVSAWCNSMSLQAQTAHRYQICRETGRWGSLRRRQMGGKTWCQSDFLCRTMTHRHSFPVQVLLSATHLWQFPQTNVSESERGVKGRVKETSLFSYHSHFVPSTPGLCFFFSPSKMDDKTGWLWRGALLPW